MTARKPKPIIFSGPMVRALLDGRKTQTRRVLKPQPEMHGGDECTVCGHRGPVDYLMREIYPEYWAPYAPGDLLWVRETWANHPSEGVIYRASGHVNAFGWRPSIHMPRWASRLTLRVTDVRVERVQDISEADALEEGCSADEDPEWIPSYYDPDSGGEPSATKSFRHLWRDRYGPDAWERNEWICARTFDALRANVDDVTP